MKTVKFGNDGIIDSRLWSTFGVSVKPTENSIGQFGTGLKYAIAVLVRNGRSIRITSGGETYDFGKQSTDFRGSEFDVITCNGEPLSFTTHLGYKWELWQAYRELFSNCVDEGGAIDYDGETVIEAELGDINHNDVFLDTDSATLIESSRWADIYGRESTYLYVKGVRVSELPSRSMFTYNLKTADLTEDRTIKYNYEISQSISNSVLQSSNRDFVRAFFLESKDAYENSVNFYNAHEKPSEECLSIVSQYRREACYKHDGFTSYVLKQLPKEPLECKDMDDYQLALVNKAKLFCEKIGFPITYPVSLAVNIGSDTLALANKDEQAIYLSTKVLSQGSKQVAATLLEEQLHLQEGVIDCTYEMQNFLFDLVITFAEKATGEIL